jgi:hypothetical protein
MSRRKGLGEDDDDASAPPPPSLRSRDTGKDRLAPHTVVGTAVRWRGFSRTQGVLLISVFVIVVVSLSVAFALLVDSRPTDAPSPAPTSTSVLMVLTSSFPGLPSSASQKRALEWLEVDSGVLSSPEKPPHVLLERYVLAVLYYATTTNGARWGNNDGWLSGGSVCEWHGVSCDANDDDAVSRLDLSTCVYVWQDKPFLPSVGTLTQSFMSSTLRCYWSGRNGAYRARPAHGVDTN